MTSQLRALHLANGQVVAFGSYETDLTTTTPVSARNWYVYNRVTHRTVFAESTVIGGPGTLGARPGRSRRTA